LFFFFFTRFALGDNYYCLRTVAAWFMYCLWNSQPLYSGKKNIKNGSHYSHI